MILMLSVGFGLFYAAVFAPTVVYMIPQASVSNQIGVSRIIAIALSIYGFLDDWVIVSFRLDRTLWEQLLWFLVIPLLLISSFLSLLRRKFRRT